MTDRVTRRPVRVSARPRRRWTRACVVSSAMTPRRTPRGIRTALEECPGLIRPRRTARLRPPHPARLSWPPPHRSNPREGLNEKPVKTRMTITSDGRRRPTRRASAAELEKATAPSATTPTTKPRIASDNARTAARTTTPPPSACGRSRARYASRPVTPRTCAPL